MAPTHRFGPALAAVLLCSVAHFATAQEAAKTAALDVKLPTSKADCLALMEALVAHAEAADMLDDQVDATDAELERMETQCEESRFEEALAAARKVEAMIKANK